MSYLSRCWQTTGQYLPSHRPLSHRAHCLGAASPTAKQLFPRAYPVFVTSVSTADLALEVQGLVKRYSDKVAVADLSFSLQRGQVLALLGPNGAGKTSTVEICEGFRQRDAGTVQVLGLDPHRDAQQLKPRIGVMLQEGGGYPGAKAGELLRLFASYAQDPLDPEQLLEWLGLQNVAKTTYRRLSGGQKQRLSLAMAVVSRPELVFLDEPTAGLDPQARHATWEIVEALRRDGVSVVLTTHYMEEAERLADQVVVVDHGRVVAAGTPEELTAHGAAGQLRFATRTDLSVEKLQLALADGYVVSESAPGNYVVAGDITPQLMADVTAWCAGEGILAENLRVEQRTLEEVFLDLTGRKLRA